MAERRNNGAQGGAITCRYFLSNTCRLGDACTFSHDRGGSRPDNTCKFYAAGHCNFGSHCRYDHVRPGGTNKEKERRAKLVPPPAAQPKSNAGCSTESAGAWQGQTPPSDENNPVIASIMTKKLRPEAAEFIPQFAAPTGVSTYAGAVSGVDSFPAAEAKPERVENILCPYHITGNCYYGDNCSYIHGNLCDLCMRPILHPDDPQQNLEHRRECLAEYEKEMEESFAMARTSDKACGICMEVVVEKKDSVARRFGILQNCKHVYCLDCIRKWRVQNKAGSIEKEVVRTCPECRVASDFVTPSKVWVEEEGEKKELIESYKKALREKACKYFKQGKGECPFGNRCFYKHANPDGTLVQGDSPRVVRRRMLEAAQRERGRNPDTFVLWEFMERAMGLDDWPSDDDDSWGDLEELHWRDDPWNIDDEGREDAGELQDGQPPWLMRALQRELDFLTFSSASSTGPRRNQSDPTPGNETGNSSSQRADGTDATWQQGPGIADNAWGESRSRGGRDATTQAGFSWLDNFMDSDSEDDFLAH